MKEDIRKVNIMENMAQDIWITVEATHIMSEPRKEKLGILNKNDDD